MENWQQTVVSQYANSPTLLRLIESINDWIDPTADLDAFYSLIWNLDTAEGYGLDVWGRIVGVSRVIRLPDIPDFFGFQEGTSGWAPFNDSPFWSGIVVSQNFALADGPFRTMILVKAAANICDGSALAINAILGTLFAGRGRCYVNDIGKMQMRYTFEFFLQEYEVAILQQTEVLPSSTGVQTYFAQIPDDTFFGFNEAGDCEPFGQGAFFGGTGLTIVQGNNPSGGPAELGFFELDYNSI